LKLLLDAGRVLELPVDFTNISCSEHDRDKLIEAVRSALAKFGRGLSGRPKALVELSGGFDSTLAAIAARTHGVGLIGVSLHFPYYEFRFEEDIQYAIAASLPVARTRLDGTALLPYTPPPWWPRFDEPATCVVALVRNLAIAGFASRLKLNRILVGHGGDHLFSENMLEPVTGPAPLARRAFTRGGWLACESVLGGPQSVPSLLKRSTLTHLDDRGMDLPLKEAFGVITRSPFTDLRMVQCGLSWTSLAMRFGYSLGKRILADAFSGELPSAVTERRGKVCWDGVCARAYAQHAASIANEIELVKEPLEHIGLNVPWLIGRVGQLARWEKTNFGSDDKEVIATYALATWLRSRGVQRMSDCSWSD
jgi:asparagine synthetase B (glutamine-hydrolysing)